MVLEIFCSYIYSGTFLGQFVELGFKELTATCTINIQWGFWQVPESQLSVLSTSFGVYCTQCGVGLSYWNRPLVGNMASKNMINGFLQDLCISHLTKQTFTNSLCELQNILEYFSQNSHISGVLCEMLLEKIHFLFFLVPTVIL